MNKTKKVSVVIAALNEEPRIGNVLKIVCGHPLVSEVIVINDGSEDKTGEIAKSFGATVLTHPVRCGKTISIHEGIDKAKEESIMLLDADLSGLRTEYIDMLAAPVLEGKVDFTMSMRGNSLGIYRFFGIDFVSGERVIKKHLLDDEFIWAKQKIIFSLEVRMNDSFLRHGAKFVVVPLDELKNSVKATKWGFWNGLREDIWMLWQISKALPAYKVIWQFLKMSRLNKKYNKLFSK
jgi:glycosyltransferase involved in cell wall biosynthesis